MANTQNYGLTLPQGWDRPDRGALAGNLQKLDGALYGLDQRLETTGYHLYNLMLQSYYDGKYTGYKRNLLFDGFADMSMIASLSAGFARDSANRWLYLDAAGQPTITDGLGQDTGVNLSHNGKISVSFTATGSGTLVRVRTVFMGVAELTVSKGGSQMGTQTLTQDNTHAERVFSLSVPIQAGQTYTVTIKNVATVTTRTLVLYRSNSASCNFGYQLEFTSTSATQGVMTSKSTALPGVVTRGAAWVRHSGGTVELALKGGDGVWRDMACTETRTTQNLSKAVCLESAFVLAGELGGTVQLQLRINTTAGNSVKVYEYGVVLG